MSRLALAVACSVLVVGSAAHAQTAGGGISNITSSASTTVNLPGFDPLTFTQGIDPTAGVATGNTFPSGSSYNSFVNVGDTQITFESSNAGAKANTSSTSSVSFKVTNNTGNNATFNSTITAAGLGFYLADTSGGCLYTGCPQATGHTFNELLTGGANVGFNFSVMSQALNGDSNPVGSPTTLYSLSGSLGMNFDGSLFLFRDLGTSGDGPSSPPTGAASLRNFSTSLGDDFDGNVADIGLASAMGYTWDATDISFGIGNGQFQTLTYETTVSSDNSMPCIANTSVCLVAYSGFGDPVGAAGAVDFLRVGGGQFLGAQGGGFFNGAGGLIGGINFAPTTFALPTFDGTTGSFQTAGVPEPATWSMMIAGFGLLGAALRRRRVLAYN